MLVRTVRIESGSLFDSDIDCPRLTLLVREGDQRDRYIRVKTTDIWNVEDRLALADIDAERTLAILPADRR